VAERMQVIQRRRRRTGQIVGVCQVCDDRRRLVFVFVFVLVFVLLVFFRNVSVATSPVVVVMMVAVEPVAGVGD